MVSRPRPRRRRPALLSGYQAPPRLSADEERELARRRDKGDAAARDRLIEANIPLALRYAQRRPRSMDMDDAVQAALIGLIRAADGFDPDRGTRFSTYAVLHIRAAIIREWLAHGRLVHIPIHLAQLLRGVKDHNYKPNGDHVAAARAWQTAVQWNAEDLDLPNPRPESGLGADEIAILAATVAALPAQQQAVIRGRYLADTGASLRAIARELQCSPETVRTAERHGLATLARELAHWSDSAD